METHSIVDGQSMIVPLDYGGGLLSTGSRDETEQRQDLSRALDVKNSAPCFKLGLPDRSELKAIIKAVKHEHAQKGQSFDLIDSTDGFSSIDAVEAWIIDAWKRKELLVLHQAHVQAGSSKAAAAESLPGRASELLIQGSDRWLLPAFRRDV